MSRRVQGVAVTLPLLLASAGTSSAPSATRKELAIIEVVTLPPSAHSGFVVAAHDQMHVFRTADRGPWVIGSAVWRDTLTSPIHLALIGAGRVKLVPLDSASTLSVRLEMEMGAPSMSPGVEGARIEIQHAKMGDPFGVRPVARDR